MKRVGIVADRRVFDGMAVHQANDEYVVAVRNGARAMPLIIPSTDASLDLADILSTVDGLLVTGAPSNVAPTHYGATARPGTELDEIRDATTLPLLRAAIAAAKPVLAICRGFQELNVALGGSLYQHVHEIPGRLDHREPQNVSREAEYAPAHAINISPDGLLVRLSGVKQAMVNSLHSQGVDRCELQEATAERSGGRPEGLRSERAIRRQDKSGRGHRHAASRRFRHLPRRRAARHRECGKR